MATSAVTPQPTPTVAMIAPNGQSGDIPVDKVQEAQQSGFKPAYDMVAPDGKTEGYVPKDQVYKAQQAGFKITNLTQNPALEGTYGMVDNKGNKVGIPYSLVDVAHGQGYQFDNSQNNNGLTPAQQFTKDQAADPNRTTGTSLHMGPAGATYSGAFAPISRQDSIERENAAEAAAPLPIKLATGVSKGHLSLARPVLDTVALATGQTPDETSQQLAPQSLAESVAKYGTMGAAGAALVPAAIAAPVATGLSLAGGAAGGYAGQKAGQAMGLSPQSTQVLGDVGGLAGGVAAPLAGRAASQYLRPSSSPAIVPPETIQAQRIAKTILPPGGIKPEFVQAIQDQAPAVKEYAQRTGNPLNTQAEGLAAARGVAQEGLEHYQQNVLSPVANRTVVLDPQSTELGDQASIGDIDNRLSKLNKLINTGSANSQGAAMDVLAKSKWADEAAYLRSKLYPALEQTTGIPAADIQQLREGYGGSFSLADGLESAQNARLTRTGQISQGQQTISSRPPSLLELPGRAINMARGGEQAIADRQFSSAMKNVQPQSPARPMPPPIDTAAVANNVQTAQQEFLRQHQLEQAAQDAAAARSQQATAIRGNIAANNIQTLASQKSGNVGNNAQGWVSQGYGNVVKHLGIDPSSGISRPQLVQFAQTPEGNGMLMRASGLSPGSPAMRNLVQQIAAKIGAPAQ